MIGSDDTAGLASVEGKSGSNRSANEGAGRGSRNCEAQTNDEFCKGFRVRCFSSHPPIHFEISGYNFN